jgi:RNA polymerase sigma-70 factor (ECF subfamily)
VPAPASGQLAFGAYRWDPTSARHRAAVLDVVCLRDGKIAEVAAFFAPELLARFALPATLTVEGPLELPRVDKGFAQPA